jgi:hypothetical protein
MFKILVMHLLAYIAFKDDDHMGIDKKWLEAQTRAYIKRLMQKRR